MLAKVNPAEQKKGPSKLESALKIAGLGMDMAGMAGKLAPSGGGSGADAGLPKSPMGSQAFFSPEDRLRMMGIKGGR